MVEGHLHPNRCGVARNHRERYEGKSPLRSLPLSGQPLKKRAAGRAAGGGGAAAVGGCAGDGAGDGAGAGAVASLG